MLDRACKDKRCKEFEPDFKVELFLDQVEEKEGEFANLAGANSLHDDVDEAGDDSDEDEAA